MRRLLPLALALLGSACFEVPALPPRDAAPRDAPARDAARRGDAPRPPLEIVAVVAEDHAGRPWPLEALPRSVTWDVETSAPLRGERDAIFLVRGEPDDALAADAARRPLTVASEARIVPSVLTSEAAHTRLTAQALEAGEVVTLVLAAFAATSEGQPLGRVAMVRGVVSSAPDAGARVIATMPADGTLEVPPNAAPFVLALDGDVSLAEVPIELEADGAPLAHEVGLARCEPLGIEAARCLLVTPAQLPRGARVSMSTTSALRDATGASVPRAEVRLGIALADDAQAPGIAASDACPIDAAPDRALGCVVATDTTWSLALRADEPARVELALPGRVVRALAPRGEVELELAGLVPAGRLDGTLSVVDLAGWRITAPLTIVTAPALAPITITEVCANPAGSEPAQEWIELANVGASAVSLEGLALADRDDLPGNVLATSRTLAPGARIVLVGEGFDADAAGVPPGAPIVVVGRTLVPAGISNAGEALFLRDPEGRRLAHVPAVVAIEGQCLVRDEPDAPRADAITDFHYDVCTPGR